MTALELTHEQTVQYGAMDVRRGHHRSANSERIANHRMGGRYINVYPGIDIHRIDGRHGFRLDE